MGLTTEVSLFHESANKLKHWQWKSKWPSDPEAVLQHLVKETKKLTPHVTAALNSTRIRMDIKWPRPIPKEYIWSATFNGQLMTGLIKWLYESKFLINTNNGTYWCDYSLASNRLDTLYDLNVGHIESVFGLNSNGPLEHILSFCYVFGGPLTSVQRRTINSKKTYAVCYPKEVIQNGV
jgi:hypothetical protein